MNMRNSFNTVLLLAAVNALLGCGDRQSNKPGDQGLLSTTTTTPSSPPSGLPTVFGQCEASWPTPSLCDWALAADAVVFGTVQSIQFSRSPSYGQENNATADCAGNVVAPLVSITLNVQNQIRGSVPSVVTFVVGGLVDSRWAPMPILKADGSALWRHIVYDGGVPAVGSQLGAAIHQVQTTSGTVWSLQGEALFTVDAGGHVVWQSDMEPCWHQMPPGLNAMTIPQVSAAAAVCSFGPSTQALKDLQGSRWSLPAFSWAALCNYVQHNPPTQCFGALDCPGVQICQNGHCIDPP